jgi:hypothetical protein
MVSDREHPTVDRGARRIWLAAPILVLLTSCAANPLSRTYEYEEEIYLDLDGSAVVYVNAAVPALVALRGAPLPVDSGARLDRQDVRAFFESPAARVVNVSTSRRDGRRYVHVRLEVDDITRLNEARPFTWSAYVWTVLDDAAEYTQRVGPSAGIPVGEVGWRGTELVGFRLHLPSRVTFHNSPTREVRRGNIIVWDQSLSSCSATPRSSMGCAEPGAATPARRG